MSTAQEAIALCFDPWAGDMDSDAVTLHDVFVVVRMVHRCAICLEEIRPGWRVRAQTQRSAEQRKVMTFRFCPTCCEAMAREDDDDDASIESRYALGMDNAAKQRRGEGAA